MTEVVYISTSAAEDNGLHALHDLVVAADGIDYRVIGGHMVQLLLLRYPTTGAHRRGTSDADAGLATPAITGPEISQQLLALGYEALEGNRYQLDERMIDLLVPADSTNEPVIHGERAYDPAPGLLLAVQSPPVLIDVRAVTTTQEELEMRVPVPQIECAVVMKALNLGVRNENKDLVDLHTLLQIVLQHRDDVLWKMAEPALKGSRRMAAHEMHMTLPRLDRAKDLPADVYPSRLAALIRELVTRPVKDRS